MRSLLFFLALLPFTLNIEWAGSLTSIVALPNQPTVTAFQQDAAENLYIAGSVKAGAFVAKLSSGGTVQFWKTFAKSGVGALAVANDGSLLIAGTTSSFPVTPNAAESQSTASAGNLTGYFAHLDTNGNVIYATYLNASSSNPGFFGIATDASGNAYLTGQGLFDSTSDALSQVNFYGNGFFVIKLDASGKIVFIAGAVGGTAIAVDSQGFIYIAGSEQSDYPLPVTSGALQSSVSTAKVCGGSTGPDGGIALPCFYQYVVKLNPTATQLVYGTWLSGSYGATPAGLWVDGDGNAVVAGYTQSSDYPVTFGAFQNTSFASLPPASNAENPIFAEGSIPAPPTSGYVTKLNAAGNALVFSTYLGGSAEDSITSMSADSEGNINLAGFAESQDFPGLPPIPNPCRPNFLYPAPFVTRLSADGSSLTETQLAYGLVVNPSAAPFPVLAMFGLPRGTAAVVVGTSLAFLSLFSATPAFTCATDAADLAPLAQLTPGQLVSLFGVGIGDDPSLVFQPRDGQVPGVLGQTRVFIHGLFAPVLYSSADQINVQVPYEVAGDSSLPMMIFSGSAIVGSGDFMATPIQPSAFVTPGYATCQGTITNSLLAVALNADGSENSCQNPATVGDTVTLFVNGLGLAGGEPTTAPSLLRRQRLSNFRLA